MTSKDELDKNINELTRRKHDMIRDVDNGVISKQKFAANIKKVEQELEELVREKLERMTLELREREKNAVNNKRNVTRELNKFKKENRSRSGRKVEEDSYSTLILKALSHPRVNSEEKTIAIVNKWKPGKDKEKLRSQIRNIVSNIKNKKQKRYEKYVWDDKKYLVKYDG